MLDLHSNIGSKVKSTQNFGTFHIGKFFDMICYRSKLINWSIRKADLKDNYKSIKINKAYKLQKKIQEEYFSDLEIVAKKNKKKKIIKIEESDSSDSKEKRKKKKRERDYDSEDSEDSKNDRKRKKEKDIKEKNKKKEDTLKKDEKDIKNDSNESGSDSDETKSTTKKNEKPKRIIRLDVNQLKKAVNENKGPEFGNAFDRNFQKTLKEGLSGNAINLNKNN